MSLYKQSPNEPNYIETVNQYADALNGAADVGTLTLFAPIAAPASASTVAATAGSGLGSGTYRYKVTFVTGLVKGDGSLYIVGETQGGPTATVTTGGSNLAVSLTNIPVGPVGTIARRIYRTAVNGADGTQKLALTIGDNTTTSYVDTVPDASLGAAVPTSNSTGTRLTGIPVPVAASDAARKDTVDTVQTNLTNHQNASAVGIHGSVSAATPNTLMHRDAAGRAKVAAPSVADDIARKAEADQATEDGLVIEAANPYPNEEPQQVSTTMGPAIEFGDGATQTVEFNRRWPWTGESCRVEAVVAADVANAGSFRAQVGYRVNGGAETLVAYTVTPGANTNLYTAVLGAPLIPAASLPQGAMVTFRFRRLGADAADTHTGKMRLHHLRLRRG